MCLEKCTIQNLAGLEAFPVLQKLSLVNCARLKSLRIPEIEETTFSIRPLADLRIVLGDLSGEALAGNPESTRQGFPKRSFENLKALCLNTSEIESLEGLEQFPGLTKLSLIECTQLESLDGLELCPQLKALYIGGGWSLEDVSALESCSCITQLTLSSPGCYDEVLIAVLKLCHSVQEVHLKTIWNEDITEELETVLGTLPHLSKLVLDNCQPFNHLDSLRARGIRIVTCLDFSQ